MGIYEITVVRGGKEKIITAETGTSLLNVLVENDVYISAACGGNGRCGKCKVLMVTGATKATSEDEKFFQPSELKEGWRLSCLSFPEENCRVVVSSTDEDDFEVLSDFKDKDDSLVADANQTAYSIAIDIGTTTVAISLVGMDSKTVIHTVTTVNRQRAYGADVISRIQSSNDGNKEALKESICKDLHDGIEKLLEEKAVDLSKVDKIAIAGNTTMGHLLMGFSCETLGVTPFTPVDISTIHTNAKELLGFEADIEVILLPGVTTYVGADITAGMMVCDFDKNEKVNVLVDLGTNGEMAIGNKEKILVTSTAAGPAFEGGNISCGMGSVMGAICHVKIDGDTVECETIGDKPMVGLCGTGVIETTYELVKEELIDETGMLDEDYFDDGYVLGRTPEGEVISFTQKDVREIQLAKSAVRAGLETLILRYGVSYDEIDTLYLAGGFGYKMDLAKAIGIGLLPEELQEKTIAIGNSSLAGAVLYLTSEDGVNRADHIATFAEEISLATDKDFNQFYTDHMFFE